MQTPSWKPGRSSGSRIAERVGFGLALVVVVATALAVEWWTRKPAEAATGDPPARTPTFVDANAQSRTQPSSESDASQRR